jgi:DNA-binding winged helix-turn-helix (wHTH) protein
LIYLFDQYEVDDEDLCLTRQGRRLPLEPRALAVLLLMLRSNGKLLKKDAILEAVWKNTIVEESTLSRAVALLRKQLGDDSRHPTFIETVPTLGYRFIAQVRASAAEEKPRVSTEVQSLATDPPPTSPAVPNDGSSPGPFGF